MSHLRFVLIEASPQRSADTRALLGAAGCELVDSLALDHPQSGHLQQGGADLLVCSVESPDEVLFSRLETLMRALPLPMLMLSADSDEAKARRSVEAGISAYVVDGVTPDRLRPVITAAMARFRQLSELASKLEQARLQLSERKLIERAKGIVMQECGLSEEEAYRLMRKTAMDCNKRVADIAGSIVSATALLGGDMAGRRPTASHATRI